LIAIMIQMEINLALGRLNAALDLLSAAAERQAGLEGERQALAEERLVMDEDRARLAAELDESMARQHALETASVAVEKRLDGLGEALRALSSGAQAAAS
jgi:Domain of unknown function (DUF4164)